MTKDPAAEWQAGYEAGVEAAAKALTFTVLSAPYGKTMHKFKIDPTKKTFVRPEHSVLGYAFEPEVVEYGRIHTDGSRSGGQPIVKTQHCPNCETNARAAERWRVRAERWRVRADQHNDECERMGIKGQAIIDQLSAENERLREAVEELLHAVCGQTGFAETVRRDSGRLYPWPALDLAEAKAIAALDQSK